MIKIINSLIAFILIFLNQDALAQSSNLRDSLFYYFKKSDYETAVNFGLKFIEESKHLQGNKDTALCVSNNDLAFIYLLLGKHNLSEPLFLESLKYAEKSYGVKHKQYASIINNYGRLKRETGKYIEAETLIKKAIAIQKDAVGEEDEKYLIIVNDLGLLYLEIGNYKAAEAQFLKVIEIRNKSAAKKGVDYGNSLNNLAVVKKYMGNYTAAENLFKQTIDLFTKINGLEHSLTATAISNLGDLSILSGNYILADSLLNKALTIKEKIFTKNSDQYAIGLNLLGKLNAKQNKNIEAEKFYFESLQIRKAVLGENHPTIAIIYSNLGDFYLSMNDLNKAENYYNQATINTKKNIGDENLSYLNLLNSLGVNYFFKKDFNTANATFLNAISLEERLLLNNLDFLTEKEILAYIYFREPNNNLPYSLLWVSKLDKMIEACFNSRLLSKGISIENTTKLIQKIEVSEDISLIALLKEYKLNKALLSKTLSQPITKRNCNTDSLSNKNNLQEKELLRKSSDYSNAKTRLKITWQDIKNKLTGKDAAIEFVKFKNIKQKNSAKDTFYYAALLLRKHDTAPIFIKLFEENQLKAALSKFAYKAAGVYVTSSTNSSKDIYHLFWQPLEPYLKNIKTIYFAPDGLLHNISFAAIPYKNNLLLSDKYNLVQLTSTRQIVLKDTNNTTPSSIALFGGINYNKQNIDTTTSANADPYSYVYQQNRGAGLDSFAYLPNTLKEVQGIKASMQAKQKNIAYYTGVNATEAAFRNLENGKSPTAVHFATHGFTLPDSSSQKNNSNTFKISDNPLLRAGLVLAGGNKGWKGNAGADEDDGILTALEISSVQLPNTQLAVLSACETGVGELRGSEGVFGLQRAFKLAGVNYIMASLWQVPDKETAEFMNTFYATWLGGKTIRQSFIATQQHMRKKYPPYFWAGFTLVQ